MEKKPVVYVSWFDAARFTNWLSNGQKTGAQDNTTTEAGAYTLNKAISGVSVTKNALAQWYIPSENEWYKAAYYNGSTAKYSLFPNGKDTIGWADANYDYYSVGHTTDVGSYTSDPSSYGTFDQAGNAFEWNDAVIYGSYRGLRGGSYSSSSDYLQSSCQFYALPTDEGTALVGFRVTTMDAVPEPSAFVLIGVGLGGIGLMRKFRRRR